MKKRKIRKKDPMKIRLYKILKEAGKKSNFWKRIAKDSI
jgi:hypothetical protein